MATQVRESDTLFLAVARALEAGRLSVMDPETGQPRLMYGVCDAGHSAAVYPERRDGRRIVSLTMHCSRCNVDLPAPLARIALGAGPPKASSRGLLAKPLLPQGA